MYPSPDGGDCEATVGVTDASGVAAARRCAAELTRAAGFDETAAGRAALVVTEAATNLLKHGGGGEVLLQGLSLGSLRGLEMLALDRGPGIPSVARALRDGYSTAGSPGNGLGAMIRQADVCDIYSEPGKGTVVLAQVWAGPVSKDHVARMSVGAACAPSPGESVSGDGWLVLQHDGRTTVLLVDGLGHGPVAADARREAVRIARDRPARGPAHLVADLHAGLRATRGAAVAVAEVDPAGGCVRFCGLGNVGAVVVDDGHVRHLVSHNGTAGHTVRRIEEFPYPWSPNAILVQYTDGLTRHWALDAYPGLAARHPSLVAGVLYRDFKRGRDDVAVVVARGVRP